MVDVMEYHQKQVPREPRWQCVTVTGMMKATEMAVDPPEEIGIVRILVLLNFSYDSSKQVSSFLWPQG